MEEEQTKQEAVKEEAPAPVANPINVVFDSSSKKEKNGESPSKKEKKSESHSKKLKEGGTQSKNESIGNIVEVLIRKYMYIYTRDLTLPSRKPSRHQRSNLRRRRTVSVLQVTALTAIPNHHILSRCKEEFQGHCQASPVL